MPSIKLNETIARAIDTNNAALAGEVTDHLRGHGWTYKKIVRRVQEVRPQVSEAEWDALLYEADEEEGRA